MRTQVAEARRSQLINTFGIGAMYPAPDQSLMICGLDEWNTPHERHEISEQRLAQSLGVSHLYSPPAGRKGHDDVPVVRFPRWYFCPDCRRLAPWTKFDTSKKHPRCSNCERDAVTSRFVMVCSNGHIDDFPYTRWVHEGRATDAAHLSTHGLTLITKGETSALSDVEVRCGCGARRTMDGSFSPAALRGVTGCTGRRPWLPGSGQEACKELPRVLQRGGSSVWFADVRSAISIPPWSEIDSNIRRSWSLIKGRDADFLRHLFDDPRWIKPGRNVDDVVRAVLEIQSAGPLDDEALRRHEYQALILGHDEAEPTDEFVCLPVNLAQQTIYGHIDAARDVARLREVTALLGFTRLSPPGTPGVMPAKLSQGQPDWLPAVEVFGEGLFVRLAEDKLTAWEKTDFAVARGQAIAQHSAPDAFVTPRKLLLHSFAHALMNELSMDAGYPVSSLRERVYAGPDQGGVLVYTATADSAGSLGGLSAQSQPERLDAVVRSAVQRALWCTSDPVCIESHGSGIDNRNLAACHACLLVPETSCEQRNCYLDRALLIGTPEQPEAGYFSDLAAQ